VHDVSKLPMQSEVACQVQGEEDKGGRREEREKERRMWKIGGEDSVLRYPGIGMSSLARNFAPIEVSYLFA